MDTRNIVVRYTLLLSFFFAFLFSLRVYYDIKHFDAMFQIQKDSFSYEVENLFSNLQTNLLDKYNILSTFLMNSSEVAHYLQNSQREKLYDFVKQDYESLKILDKDIYVMHFVDRTNKTVLRLHKPNDYGDDLTTLRPMMANANRSLKQQVGFEVGKNGLVYRVSTPFIVKEEHLGVIEFGINMEYFTDAIDKRFDFDSVVLVKTEKMDILTKPKAFSQLEEYSVITQNELFPQIIKFVDLHQNLQVVTLENKHYLVFNNLNFYDFEGNVVAKTVIIKDISSFIIQNNYSLFILNIVTLGMFIMIVFGVYILLNRFSLDIEKSFKTIGNLHLKSEYLKTKVNTDELTKLYNKRYFESSINTIMRKNRVSSIIFFDIDHFKKINDSYGHQVGDNVLQELSLCIKTELRKNDTFVRWGGEEFAIVLEDVPLNLAIEKAEDIRKMVEKYHFSDNLQVTLSLGVTQIKPHDTKESLVQRVDELLYKAKNSGRNCTRYN